MSEGAEGRVVTWFREESRSSLRSALLPGFFCAALAWGLLAVAWGVGPSPSTRARVTLPREAIVDATGTPLGGGDAGHPFGTAAMGAGILLALFTPFAFAYGIRRSSRPGPAELLLCTEALVYRRGDERLVLPWSEIEAARIAESGASRHLSLVRHDGSALDIETRFHGVAPEELLSAVRSFRGRVLFGLLDSPAWPESRRRDDPS